LPITGALTSRLPATLNENSIFYFFFSSEDDEDDNLFFFNLKSIAGFSIEP
jgi:hypothetical protein